MITKKLGKITFGWDANALKGKGYWYVLGKDESFSRAASSTEAMKLGTPKQQDAPKKGASDRRYFGFKTYFDVDKEGRPVRRIMRTGSEYEMADINRSKGLQQLATEKLLSGSSLGGAVKGAIGDRAKSIVAEAKRVVDPMNYLSKIPGIGQLAAAYYGKTRGRTAEDISYFTGVRTAGVDQEEMDYMPVRNEELKEESSKAEKITTPIKTVYRDEKGRFAKAPIDSVDSLSEEEKQEAETQDKGRHEELIEAIKKSYLWGVSSKGDKKGKNEKGIFDLLKSVFDMKGVLGQVFNIMKMVGPLISSLAPALGVIAAGFAGYKLGDWLNEKFKISEKIVDTIETSKDILGVGQKIGEKKSAEDNYKNNLLKNSPDGKISPKAAEVLKQQGVTVDPKTVRTEEEQKTIYESNKKKNSTYESLSDTSTNNIIETEVYSKKSGLLSYKANTVEELESKLTQDVKSGKITLEESNTALSELRIGTEESTTKLSNTTTNQTNKNIEDVQTSLLTPLTTPSALSQRVTSVVDENQKLKSQSSMESSGSPVVVNSPTTNVVNNSTSGGGSSARIRNDDPVLTRVQYQNARPV